jgi:hypothetical protein
MGALLEIKDMVCINTFTVKAFKFWLYFNHKYEALYYLKRRPYYADLGIYKYINFTLP